MNHLQHKKEFDKIIEKYGFKDEQKAGEIADFLTKHEKDKVSVKEFATLFNMDEHDAITFLGFIHKGLRFKEEHIDKNKHQ